MECILAFIIGGIVGVILAWSSDEAVVVCGAKGEIQTVNYKGVVYTLHILNKE